MNAQVQRIIIVFTYGFKKMFLFLKILVIHTGACPEIFEKLIFVKLAWQKWSLFQPLDRSR